MPVFVGVHFGASPEGSWMTVVENLAERYAVRAWPFDETCICLALIQGEALQFVVDLHHGLTAQGAAPAFAIHVGVADRVGPRFVGPTINQICLLAQLAAPEQVVLTEEFHDLINPSRDVELRSLGLHQLPDLSMPQRILQLTHPELEKRDFPPLKTLRVLPNNLQPQTEPFVGRHQALRALETKLRSAKTRLLTLIGPGGVGKTRLALQTAARCARYFADGVFFVDLSALTSPNQLFSAVIDALEIDVPPKESPRDFLLRYLKRREMLLILDTFELVLPAREAVSTLLQAAPRLKIMITSRQALRLPIEETYPVRGLSYPPKEMDQPLESYAAIRLFAQSAQRVSPLFMLKESSRGAIAQICRELGGMPLGIKMVAAWTRYLSCDEIASMITRDIDAIKTSLRDIPPRQRSLQAVFQHSWEMLSLQEQRFFSRLTVFRGDFSVTAAVTIADGAPELLQDLYTKSFLWRSSQGHYHHHVPLRQYVVERLYNAEVEREKLQERHACYYTDLLVEQGQRVHGPGQREALHRLSDEIDNIRTAWQWMITTTQTALMDKALQPTYELYRIRGYLEAGIALCQQAVQALAFHTQGNEALSAKFDMIAAAFLISTARLGKAETLLESSLSVFEKEKLRHEQAFTLQQLGRIAYQRGDFSLAQAYFTRSYEWCKLLGHLRGIAELSFWLGRVNYTLAGYRQARRFYQRSMSIYRELGDELAVTNLLVEYGEVDFNMGAYDQAQKHYLESLHLHHQYAGKSEPTKALIGLGTIAMDRGGYEEARQYFERCLSIGRKNGDARFISESLTHLSAVYAVLGDYEKAQSLGEEALHLQDKVEDLASAAFVETFHGGVCFLKGDLETAKDHLERSREMLIEAGDRHNISFVNNILGRVYLAEGDIAQAEHCYERNARFNRAQGARPYLLSALSGLAAVSLAKQEWSCAAQRLCEALTLGGEMDAFSELTTVLNLCAKLAQAQGEQQQAALIWTFLVDYRATYALLRDEITSVLETLPEATLRAAAQEAEHLTVSQLIEQVLNSPTLEGAYDA
jgi:predicted ATPase/TolA-binding protein